MVIASISETATAGGGIGSQPTLDIRSDRVADHPVGLLLGVHSLWWGLGSDYVKQSRLVPVLRDLFTATEGITRFGGGVNEADWTLCGAEPAQRVAAKVVSWADAMRCNFGWSEYLSNTLVRGQGNAWLIANVVGNAGVEYSSTMLTDRLRAAATHFKQLAPNATRFWELGNELERGDVRWSAEKIAERLKLSASALREVDPQATLVFPLTEFDPYPQWPRKKFNQALLSSAAASFTNYALHQYYEGAPGGPRVNTQLMNVRELAAQLNQHVGKDGVLWITEHGRWPVGLPSDANWEANWWLTNSMSGVRATADYLIGLSQIAAVKGAMLHGLRAGPWNVVEAGAQGPALTGVGKLLLMLAQSGAKHRLTTISAGSEFPTEWSPYRARVAGFETANPGEYVMWGVNNSNAAFDAKLLFGGMNRVVDVLESSTLSCPAQQVECRSTSVAMGRQQAASFMLKSTTTSTTLTLPANSVFTVKYRLR